MNILIIGSEGFIGSHCVNYFINKNHKITGCDILDKKNSPYTYLRISRLSPQYEELFKNASFDVCINAAGNGSVPVSVENPLLDFEANVFDTLQILDCIRKHQRKCKFIYLSSAAVYGNPLKLPITENDPTLPISPYGWHKLMGEALCKEYYTLYNIQSACLRPFSVFGPRLKKQIVWDIFQKIKSNPKKIEIYGTGNESRDFIYINDVVASIEIIINKSELKADIYNIASGQKTKISELVEILVNDIAPNIQIDYTGTTREGDPLFWEANIEKLKSLGYTSKFKLDEGITKTLKWLKEQA